MPTKKNTTPFVLFPRFTTIAGVASFETAALNVERYSEGWATAWRGNIVGGGATPTFTVSMQESEDQQTWQLCGGPSPTASPGPAQERGLEFTISKRWLRASVLLDGDAPVVTLWLLGFLMPRGKPSPSSLGRAIQAARDATRAGA